MRACRRRIFSGLWMFLRAGLEAAAYSGYKLNMFLIIIRLQSKNNIREEE